MKSRVLILGVISTLLIGCTASTETQLSVPQAKLPETTIPKDTAVATETEIDASLLQTSVNAYLNTQWSGKGVTAVVDPDGRVTLDGVLSTTEERDALESGVAAIPGVLRVRDRISISNVTETNAQ